MTDPTSTSTSSATSGGDNPTLSTVGLDRPRTMRVDTIVWGFILLGIAALYFTLLQFDLTHVNPGVIAAWVAMGIGSLSIVGGLIGAIARRR